MRPWLRCLRTASILNPMLKPLTILSVLCLAYTAQAERVCLKLDNKTSSLTFDATVGPVPLTGKFTSYQSGWGVETQNPESSIVTFAAQPNAFRLASNDQASVLVDTLLRSIPADPIMFRSSAIRRIAGHRFVVEGVVIRGTKKKNIRFPVEMLSLSPEGGEIRATLEGSALDLIPGTEVTGSVTARLIYQRGNPSNCP